MKISFILNGLDVTANVNPEKRLIDILREDFHLTQTRAACYGGRCGSCLILLNGLAVPSCMVPAFEVRNTEVITHEGFMETQDFMDITRAFEDSGYTPCVSCFGPKTMLISNLLEKNLNPTIADINTCMTAVPCECADFDLLVRAIRRSAMYIGRRRRARRK